MAQYKIVFEPFGNAVTVEAGTTLLQAAAKAHIAVESPCGGDGICGRCMLRSYCLGKCRAQAYYDSGSLLAPLSFCQVAYEEGLFPQSRLFS